MGIYLLSGKNPGDDCVCRRGAIALAALAAGESGLNLHASSFFVSFRATQYAEISAPLIKVVIILRGDDCCRRGFVSEASLVPPAQRHRGLWPIALCIFPHGLMRKIGGCRPVTFVYAADATGIPQSLFRGRQPSLCRLIYRRKKFRKYFPNFFRR